MKTELEEVAEKQYPKCIVENPTCNSSSDSRFIDTNEELRETFIDGAKWQAEQDKDKYSAEEVIQLNVDYNKHIQTLKNGIPNFAMWFKENKKKQL